MSAIKDTAVSGGVYGTTCLPSGVRVDLNPNPVGITVVASGTGGCILAVSALGVSISAALDETARTHLIRCLHAANGEARA